MAATASFNVLQVSATLARVEDRPDFEAMVKLHSRASAWRGLRVCLTVFLFVGCSLSTCAQRASPSPTILPLNPMLPTIFVVGDSTANNNANGALGWGDPFVAYFDTTRIN